MIVYAHEHAHVVGMPEPAITSPMGQECMQDASTWDAGVRLYRVLKLHLPMKSVGLTIRRSKILLGSAHQVHPAKPSKSSYCLMWQAWIEPMIFKLWVCKAVAPGP